MANLENPTPRVLLERYLKENELSPYDFSRGTAFSYNTVRNILDGNIPHEPKALHAIGNRISAGDVWPEIVAAGIVCIPVERIHEGIPGSLWAYMIRRGLTVQGCATAHHLPIRVVQIALNQGRPSKRLINSGLLDAIGIGEDHPIRKGPAEHGDPKLRDLITNAMQTEKISKHALHLSLGLADPTIGKLMCGVVPRQLSPPVVPLLAKKLRIDLRQLSSLLALWWRARKATNQGLKFLLARHLFLHGLMTETMARRCKLSVGVISRILNGSIPDSDAALDALRHELGVSEEEWDAAVARQRQRILSPSESYESLKSSLLPLSQLIEQRIAETSLIDLAQRVNVSPNTIRRIVTHHHVPRCEEVKSRLANAFGLDRAQFAVSCRLMAETVPQRERLYETIIPATGIQETFLRLLREQGVSVPNMVKDCGVSRRIIDRVLKSGVTDLSTEIQEKLRNYLGLSLDDWMCLLDPLEAGENVDDDDEMRLLSAYRKLSSTDQLRLREIAGRMLANQPLVTLVGDAWKPR